MNTLNASPTLAALARLKDDNIIRPLDYQFARLLEDMGGDPVTMMTGALVSHELASGNVCLPLTEQPCSRLFGISVTDLPAPLDELAGHDWLQALTNSRLVSDGSDQATPAPMVLSRQRVYLYRYWQYEHTVARHLRNKQPEQVDIATVRTILDRLFRRDYQWLFNVLHQIKDNQGQQAALKKWLDIACADSDLDWDAILAVCQQARQGEDLQPLDSLIPDQCCLNWQKVAAALAATQSFTVISGGPGTGKTTTVTRLLAMLVELNLSQGKKPPLIRLVAPTGKASARLTESIGGALQQLNCDERVRDNIPSEAGTIHRLLGVIPNSHDFRHNQDNPLHLDILVVDEASMVDLPMMTRLLAALPATARIILLGDRDQLASVEAGSVLGDICAAAGNTYSNQQKQLLQNLTGYQLNTSPADTDAQIHDCFCLLQKSYRFDASSGIGQLAAAVNSGSWKNEKQVWQSGFQDIRQHPVDDTGYQSMLKLCVTKYRPYLTAIKDKRPAREVLNIFNQFRLLCALREGPFGVQGLNTEIRAALARNKLIEAETLWYPGRPVLITRNDHGLGLYNGDVGITIPGHNDSGDVDNQRLRVVFQLPGGSLKALLPSRLPEHETVFAMTIHKSQGSEFAHTAMILPDTLNPVLTRELVYTGITRAKTELDIFTSENVLSQAIARPTHRSSGLEERLLG